MAAAAAHGVHTVAMRDQVAQGFDVDRLHAHGLIEARPAAEGKRARQVSGADGSVGSVRAGSID
jgi:hypothetical protein